MRYPKECPVFEDISGYNYGIVVGTEPHDLFNNPAIWGIVVSDGQEGCWSLSQIKPLNAAAREMYAIAEEMTGAE